MFVGNISQYDKESRFLPEYIRPWIEKLVSLEIGRAPCRERV